jgi:hypothetical protein
MALYLIVALGNSAPVIDAAVAQKMGASAYKIENGKWVAHSTAQTSKEVSDAIGISSDNPATAMVASAVVVAVRGYYGRAPNTLWEWMAANYS